MCKLDATIRHDIRMRIPNLTQPNLKEFIQILLGCYAVSHCSKFVLCKSSHSRMQPLRMPKLAKGDNDDAINYDPLRMRKSAVP
jgi:hypothetical protein